MEELLKFEISKSQSGKTKILNITSAFNGSQLGFIAWYAPWRRYCFYPDEESIFDYKCMINIAEKINELMIERG